MACGNRGVVARPSRAAVACEVVQHLPTMDRHPETKAILSDGWRMGAAGFAAPGSGAWRFAAGRGNVGRGQGRGRRADFRGASWVVNWILKTERERETLCVDVLY